MKNPGGKGSFRLGSGEDLKKMLAAARAAGGDHPMVTAERTAMISSRSNPELVSHGIN